MFEILSSFEGLELIFFYIGLISTIVLVFQIVLMVMGIGSDFDTDLETDMSSDFEFSLLFSIKGIIAFFSIGAWSGLIVELAFSNPMISLLIAFLSGSAALYAMYFLTLLILKLASDGTKDIKNAVNEEAVVYQIIPKNKEGVGKVNCMLQGSYVELSAMSTEDFDIETGSVVEIVDIIDENIVLVIKKKGDNKNV